MDFASAPPRRAGRYWLFEPMAAGGMATIHLGRLSGPGGFSRPVAIKRLHEHLARDPKFVAMFLDEARIASRVRHPNVVGIVDVVSATGEVLLVMELVHGESLGALLASSAALRTLPAPSIVSRVMLDVLEGLQAAHDATGEEGAPLGVVHRDVSPQNVLVGIDGVARVADFGIAKALGRMHQTRSGEIKGKLAYMAPEVFDGDVVDARVDVYGAAVVLWELLAGRRLFQGDEGKIVVDILTREVPPPSSVAPWVTPAIDAVVLGGLARDPNRRFASAKVMARALEVACPPSPREHVSAWVSTVARQALEERARFVRRAESFAGTIDPPESRRREELVARVSRRSAVRGALVGGGAVAVVAGLVAGGVWLGVRAPEEPPPPPPDEARHEPMAEIGLTTVGCSFDISRDIQVATQRDTVMITQQEPFASLVFQLKERSGTVAISSARFKEGELVSLSTPQGHWAWFSSASARGADPITGKIVIRTYRPADGVIDLQLIGVVLEETSSVNGKIARCTFDGVVKTHGKVF